MSLTPTKSLAVLLGSDLSIELQMRWAISLAVARKLDLLILHPLEDDEDRVSEVALDESPGDKASGVIHELTRVIEESPRLRAGSRECADQDEDSVDQASHIAHVRLKVIHFASVASQRRALLDELEHEDVVLATRALGRVSDMSDTDVVRERRLFFRFAPCELVQCRGLTEQTAFSRILVATDPARGGRAALWLGVDLATAGAGAMTALHVNPDVGDDSERVGRRRLTRILNRTLGTERPDIECRVVVHNHVSEAIRDVWDEGHHDIVVTGASGSRPLGDVGAGLGKGATIITVTPASPVMNRVRAFVEEGVQGLVPQIAREERVALVDRVQSSAAWNFDFLTLMVLSTTMAAIGLIQNSAAVVIGAMLVAPLMTPLLGLGLALVQGNPVLARLSLRSVVLALCVSLLGGWLVGVAAPLEEPTREMLARGGPGLLDLAVAFAAGLAAAYASSRPSLIAALPGVAIAAALVPPIATSGLALSLGDVPLAIGALLLFVINMVTIVLAAMIALWLVGIRNIRRTSLWIHASGATVIAATLTLGVFLSLQSKEYELTESLPAGLVAAVEESVEPEYLFESLAVAYDELGVQLNIQVSGREPAPTELATTVRTLISNQYRQPVRVRLLTRIADEPACESDSSASTGNSGCTKN